MSDSWEIPSRYSRKMARRATPSTRWKVSESPPPRGSSIAARPRLGRTMKIPMKAIRAMTRLPLISFFDSCSSSPTAALAEMVSARVPIFSASTRPHMPRSIGLVQIGLRWGKSLTSWRSR